jgi:heme oxygenase (mycobilin-producing)
MVKVLVERQLKRGEDIGHLLHELHQIAVQRKGHVSNETWIGAKNNRTVTILSTWQTLADWKAWAASKDRARILKAIEPLLAKETRITEYEIMSPADCDYFIDPASWMQELEHPHFDG